MFVDPTPETPGAEEARSTPLQQSLEPEKENENTQVELAEDPGSGDGAGEGDVPAETARDELGETPEGLANDEADVPAVDAHTEGTEVDGNGNETKQESDGPLNEQTPSASPPDLNKSTLVTQTEQPTRPGGSILRVAFGFLPASAANAPAAYFIKDAPNEILRSAAEMEKRTHFGALAASGPSLGALEQIISLVFMPLFGAADESGSFGPGSNTSKPKTKGHGLKGGASQKKEGSTASKENAKPSNLPNSVALELAADARCFGAHLGAAAKRLAGDVYLSFPKLRDGVDLGKDSPNQSAEDEDTARKLETCVVEWTGLVAGATRTEENRQITGLGPLDEIEFWRDRDVNLTRLHEQLVSKRVRDVTKVVAVASPAVMPDFDEFAAKLQRMCGEARDNRKFLATLERHFRNITHWRRAGGRTDGQGAGNDDFDENSHTSLATAIDTVSPLMSALRMVWIISRHYGEDTMMEGLMGRVADEVGKVAAEAADVKNASTGVFAVDAKNATRRVTEARQLLDTWKESYMAMREKIEKSGRDNRWEFDRKRLFGRTEYVSGVCGDLSDMLRAVDGFHNFLGAKLKTVTGEPEAIDAVIGRVTAMKHAVRDVSFDPFDPKRFADWGLVVSEFEQQRRVIEHAAKAFVDASFKKLRSAEDAFDLLVSFHKVELGSVMGSTMGSKFVDILEQFTYVLAFPKS